jgi:hypothetical protein
MTREEAIQVAAQRKAARRRRTGRIRKAVAVVAVTAFLGPFALIYSHSESTKVAKASASTTSTTSSPAPVTTQQS